MICAAEFLKMSGSVGRGGLSCVAENVLFDLSFAGRTKRDYGLILNFIEKALKYPDFIEKSGVYRKLIESFVENLTIYVKTSAIYDSICIYNKSNKYGSSKKSLHSLLLSEEQMNIINNLPLKWMNDIIKCALRFNLNQSLNSYLIQSYIDYNTNINDYQNERNKSEIGSEKDSCATPQEESNNLINIASDILKLTSLTEEKKMSNLIDMAGEILDHEPQASSNLIQIANEVLETESEPSHLIGIAANILKTENTMANLVLDESFNQELNNSYAEEIDDKTENSETITNRLIEHPTNSSNLIEIAGQVLAIEEEKPLGLIEIVDQVLDSDNKSSDLIHIGDQIISEKSLTVNEAALENNEIKPINLIGIASNIFSKSNELTSVSKSMISDKEKLDIIRNLINIFIDLRIDPEFPISWLLLYAEELNRLNADSYLKSTFIRWCWNALNGLKPNSNELSEMLPSTFIHLVNEVLYDTDTNKNDLNKVKIKKKY